MTTAQQPTAFARLVTRLCRLGRWRLAAVAILAIPMSVAAQPGNDDPEPEVRWYEVEVVIFARQQSPEIAYEQWPTDLDLSYPSNWVELVGLPDENTPEQEGEEGQADSETDGGQLIDESLAAEPGVDAEENNDVEPEFDPLRDIAYHVLPEEELQLADEARRLRRRYRVLFHQAWRQPFTRNADDVPAILIYGGDRYGDHHELEGSIRVNFRRWLHLETDLWLTQFARNYGQETENWPELPLKPNRQSNVAGNWLAESDEEEAGAAGNTLGGGGFNWNNNNWSNDDDWKFQPLTSTYDSILAKPFVEEHIVLMQETRKVNRSEEIHYIDHPQLGVLVHFSRYQPPEPQTSDAELQQQQLNEALGIPQ